MNRRKLLGVGALALIAPSQALARERYLTIPYVPLDTRPYYDPVFELRPEHVDSKIWPAVKRINESGWVWTAESCQGHRAATAYSKMPMLRLVCQTQDAGRMLGALLLVASVGQERTFRGEGRIELRRHAPAPKGWFEVQTFIRRGGISVFNRFAERVNV